MWLDARRGEAVVTARWARGEAVFADLRMRLGSGDARRRASGRRDRRDRDGTQGFGVVAAIERSSRRPRIFDLCERRRKSYQAAVVVNADRQYFDNISKYCLSITENDV
jgi:hypothetical protein